MLKLSDKRWANDVLAASVQVQYINANKQRQCFGNASTYGNTTYGNATCYWISKSGSL